MITIRKAVKTDAQAIFEAEQKYIDCPWNLEQVCCEIENPSAVFLTAESDGTFAGYLSGVIAADECEVSNIAVEQQFRHAGIGGRLMQVFLSELKERHVSSVFLLVRDGNVPAIGLYEKHGFKAVGKRSRYYTGGDALIMRLDI